ncbi:MAG: YggS family pyridoxal phosphate-dependent enzyme [Bacteroidota bacterium]|nr:YggS family pyridoxal phosphate-dependent enzyme [Bacteroidota bacterium]
MLDLKQNMADVRERVRTSCARAGREVESVRLIAVTKTVPPEWINQAISLGITDVGENRVQEYLSKRDSLLPHTFHFIGRLQRNKVRHILPYCAWIHSVDSLRLAEEIQHRAESAGLRVNILLEVNVSGEESKGGIPPQKVVELADGVLSMPNIECRGLMTVPEASDDPESVRPAFRMLRLLLEELRRRYPGRPLTELSMGMSADFETAIEEGATMVRLGTAIFGPRSCLTVPETR